MRIKNQIDRDASELNSTEFQELKSLLEEFSLLLFQNDIFLTTLKPTALAYFNSLGDSQRQIIIENFKRYFEIVSDVRDSGIELRDTRQSLWRISQRFRWRMNDEVLNSLEDDDVVEVYLPDQSQLYRNLNYFKKTSYTIADLVFYPWSTLVEHSENAVNQLKEIGQKIFTDHIGIEMQFRLDPYIAKERFSEKRLSAELISKSITAIRGIKSKKNEGALVVWKIDLIDEASVNHEKGVEI